MNSVKILIADDHELVRRSLRTLIESHTGWEVCGEAADGKTAFEKATELKPDIVVLDMSMPEMNGLEAARLMRQKTPECQILMISQNDHDLMKKSVEEAGVQGFVPKSALPQELLLAIDALIKKTPPAWFKGSGQMFDIMCATDWSKTPLGPAELWSPSLRMMVNFLLANRFPQLLWWGPQFCSLYNDAYIPILGDKHPWAIGRPVAEVWQEIWHVLKPLVETPFHGGPATWMEDIELVINRRGFAEETHFTIAYSPVPDESVAGGIGGVLATVHEITEKVIGERRIAALRELGAGSGEPKSQEEACEDAARILSRHSKDVPFVLLYLMDSEGQAARLAGSAGADLNASPGLEKFDNLKAQEQIRPVARMIETEQIYVIENLQEQFQKLPQSAPSNLTTAAAIVPLRSNIAHHLAGFMIVGISPQLQFDESYRNFLELMSTQIASAIANARAYEEERKRAEALAEIDRAKTAFFSNISHEFRTPLTLMMGPLEDALAQAEGLPSADRDRLSLIHRNSRRLLKLVNTLLDFSRIEAGRIQASYEPTDLPVLTAELASVFRSAVERAGMKLVIDCPALPEMVYLDREMWEKIVLNLLSNAFKFTFEGEIAVSLRCVGSNVEMTVRDSGTGIPADEIPQLFERFHRVRGARGRSYEGSGIGLALVQELVKLHGGSVRVESEVERGSSFVVTIPFGKDHLPYDRIGRARTMASTSVSGDAYVQEALRWLPKPKNIALEPPPQLAHETKHRPCVLLADDNADMREYVERLLREQYEVIAVEDGESALKCARDHCPDLILSDAMMPRMDGFELLRQLRGDQNLKSIPLILLSARAGEESRVEGLAAGADDYLVKPFSARELLARIGAHISMAKIRREAAEQERALRGEAELERNQIRELFMHTNRQLEERNADILRQAEQVRELSWRLLRTQDEERRHIARELHDSAGQTLAVLGMNLGMIVQAAEQSAPEIAKSAQETQELVQQLTKEIRTTSYLLHPPLLDENGLPAALSWYIRGLTERSGLDIAFNISEEFGRLPRDMELVVFRLVQECLTNIHRHSGSQSAAIQITRDPDRVLIEVRDQGKGIAPEKLAQIQSKGSGVGIRGMRERLRQFQGELIIDSNSSGTTVVVTIPISQSLGSTDTTENFGSTISNS